MTILRLQNDVLSVGVSTAGGAVTQLSTRSGHNVLRPLQGDFDPRHAASFPLIPIGNRVAGNRFALDGTGYQLLPNDTEQRYLHGDGWISGWVVDHEGDHELRLSLEVTQPRFGPHRYRAEQVFTLDGPRLHMDIAIENRGKVPLPFGIGLHPYFPNDGAEIAFTARRFWTEGPGHIPETPQDLPPQADFRAARALQDLALNNAYEHWDGRAHIRWPSGLQAEMTADPVFSMLMVFAPADDRSFFCLEPMSHLPNALGHYGPEGMAVLAPGQRLSGRVSIAVSPP